MDLGIKGRVALITGASRGIGRASAIELAREGCHLVLAARNEALLTELGQEVKALGVEVVTVGADLETATGVNRMMDAAFEVFGHVDILFNNAGHNRDNTPIGASDDQWQAILNIHLMAQVRACRRVIPKMQERGWGRIINMSSVCGLTPKTGLADYSAAKAAVINYTKSLALEYSKYGICSTAICPGLILTGDWDNWAADVATKTNRTKLEVLDSVAAQCTAIKRFGTLDEVTKVIAFLASEGASYMSGCAIQVDGGALAGMEIHY